MEFHVSNRLQETLHFRYRRRQAKVTAEPTPAATAMLSDQIAALSSHCQCRAAPKAMKRTIPKK
jgi:hypothetical protein